MKQAKKGTKKSEVETTDLVVVDYKEFGMTKTDASEVSKVFKPMLDKALVLEKKFNKVIKLKKTKENIDKFKALRDEFQLVENKVVEIHKTAKQYWLNGGRFVDAFKNVYITTAGEKKKLLKDAINYEKIEAKKKLDELRAKRNAEIETLSPGFVIGTDLALMDENVYQAFKDGIINSDRIKKDAEEQAKKEEAKQKEIDDLKAENLRKENEILQAKETKRKNRSNEMQPYIIFIRDHEKMINMDDEEYYKELSEIQEAARLHAIDQKRKADEEARKKAEAEAEAERIKKINEGGDSSKFKHYIGEIKKLEQPKMTTGKYIDYMERLNKFLNIIAGGK